MLNRDNLRHVVLLRIVSGGPRGATRSELHRDIWPLVRHAMEEAAWPHVLDGLVTEIAQAGLLERIIRGRLIPAIRCVEAVEAFCGGRLPKRLDWPTARNSILVAVALELRINQLTRLKALGSADGLRMAVLERAYGLRFKAAGPTTSELRNALAQTARARGCAPLVMSDGRLSSDVIVQRMSPDDARWIAAGLAGKGVSCRTDIELISHLAALQVGADEPDSRTLRSVVVQRFLGTPRIEADCVPRNLESFAHAVTALAAPVATGWAGNRKAFISHVWEALCAQHAGWGYEEAHFKELLVDAHRAGFLTLSNADLREATQQREIAASATSYMNTDWHYIRVTGEAAGADLSISKQAAAAG